jgi:hypothetical protein
MNWLVEWIDSISEVEARPIEEGEGDNFVSIAWRVVVGAVVLIIIILGLFFLVKYLGRFAGSFGIS